jgi:predicted RNase H-like HicB family nuclease
LESDSIDLKGLTSEICHLVARSGKMGLVATILEYMTAAMRHAEYERLDTGEWYAHIPGCEGLWAIGATLEDARAELYSTLDGWLYVNAFNGTGSAPVFEGATIYSPPPKVE